MAELLLDPSIRGWVFLPIVVITFLIGIIRHYLSIISMNQAQIELSQMQDNQILLRSRLLRENAHFLPPTSFFMRRQFFNEDTTGCLKQIRSSLSQNPMMDPTMMTNMLKNNVTDVLPMVIVGGWINWMFSGFVTTQVPFPLTLRFKSMLQRGVNLTALDASWVSSASWYFLNIFGLRSIYTLVLGEYNVADQFAQFEDQFNTTTPTDMKAAFKAEREALEMITHKWCLIDEPEFEYRV